MKPPEPCPVFSACWCAVAGRENNPHCSALNVPIESNILAILIVSFILVYVFCKKHKPLTEAENQKRLLWKLFFISIQTKWIFKAKEFNKEYFNKAGELKNKYKETL